MGLVEEIRKAGLWDDGYCIQQDPEELAALVDLLQRKEPMGSYLAIGIAAGGVERFLLENVIILKMAIIDDGAHPQFNTQWFSMSNDDWPSSIPSFIGDSHSGEARNFLEALGRKFDVVGIDGDHSPQGVAQDWELVQPYLAPGAIVWFHDIKVSEPGQTGARKLWARLKTEHEVLLETNGQFGIGVIRV